MQIRALGGLTFLTLCASLMPAANFTYDGSILPGAFGFPDQVAGAHAAFSPSSSGLTMTTAFEMGIWFGGYHMTAGSAQGNYLSVNTRVSTDASDWYIYLGDGANLALLSLSAGQFNYQTADNLFTLPHDLTSAFHTFDIWMKSGVVTYALDHSVFFSGAAVGYGGDPLLIGDPSGGTIGTTGSMYIDRVTVVNGADFDSAPAIPDSPEPSTWMLCGAAMAVAGYKHLRSR